MVHYSSKKKGLRARKRYIRCRLIVYIGKRTEKGKGFLDQVKS